MKSILIASIMMLTFQSHGTQKTPYIDQEYDSVVIKDTAETKVSISDCSIKSTTTKYFGKSPICVKELACRRGEISNIAIVEPSYNEPFSIYCPKPSESADCKSISWQKCMIDDTFPESLPFSCSSDKPGETKPGCPDVDSVRPQTQPAGGPKGKK